jgi:hypothetical protein
LLTYDTKTGIASIFENSYNHDISLAKEGEKVGYASA